MTFSLRKKNKRIAERKTETSLRKTIDAKPLGIAAVLWFITLLLFFGSGVVPEINLVEGQKAPATIIASVPFNCENLSETSFAQNKAATEVPPIFIINAEYEEKAIQLINAITSRLNEYHQSSINQKKQIQQSIQDLLLGTDLKADLLINSLKENEIINFQQEMVMQ